jgi:hypothetical protein
MRHPTSARRGRHRLRGRPRHTTWSMRPRAHLLAVQPNRPQRFTRLRVAIARATAACRRAVGRAGRRLRRALPGRRRGPRLATALVADLTAEGVAVVRLGGWGPS